MGLAGLWLLLLAAFLTLHWAILPKLDQWRPELEALATDALRDSGGARLQIGSLSVRSGGWMPVLDLRDLRLVDPEGRTTLHLPQLSAQVSARSLLAWPPRLEQLYLHAPRLSLRRDAQGRVWLGGILLPAAHADAHSAALDGLLRQSEIALKDGRLDIVDETEGGHSLSLTALDGVLRSGLRRHELRVDATPPPELGQRFSLRARVTHPLFARPGDWRRWSGLLYADLPQTHAAALHRHLRLPVTLAQGDGALRAWAELARGELRELTLDLALRQVQLRLAPSLVPLSLNQLAGRVAWQRLSDGSRWSLRGLQFELPPEGPGAPLGSWPASNLTLSLQHAPQALLAPPPLDALRGGLLQADRIDLGLLARVASSLPLGPPLHEALLERAPRGRVQSLELSWQGRMDAPSAWRASGAAQQLAWTGLEAADGAALGQPGLSGASLRFSATQQGGEARLQVRDGALDYPGLLDAARVPLQRADAELRWRRDKEQRWSLEGRQLLLQTEGLRASGSLDWHQTEQAGGHLKLQLKAPQLALPTLPSLLPLALQAEVRRYLQDSLLGGTARQLSLQFDGAPAAFPFREPGSGSFKVQAQVQDARFAFVPSHAERDGQAAFTSPWPAFEGLHGQLSLEGPGLRLRAPRARIAGLEVADVDARIDDMGRDATLQVGGRWRGELPQALAFVRATPVMAWTQQAFGQARGSGAVSGQLHLTLPLAQLEKTQLRGSVQLPGVALQFRDDLPPFADVRGHADFTESGVRLNGLTARFLGGALRLSGGTQDGPLLIDATGQATAEGLRAAAREWPALASLAPALSGQTDYQLRLAFKSALPELELRSNLQGLASSLPAPLAKAAADSWPLLLRVQPMDGGGQREAWGLSLGAVAQALLERDGPRTRRGLIRIGPGDMSLPAEGLVLAWSAPEIDLDPWRQRLGGGAPGGDGFLPARIQLDTPVLRVAQRRLTQASLSVQQLPARQAWQLALKSEQASGELLWRDAGGGQPPSLQARFSRLALPPEETQQVDAWLDSSAASAALPALDIEADDFQMRGRKLGRLSLKAAGAPAGRDWSLQSLVLAHPDATLNASGQWRAADKRTQLDWQLAIDNSGRWLDALGFGNTVRGGRGELKGQLSWKGSPLAPSAAGLDGHFSMQLAAGQFLKADPGVARLLGVLSLQSLPRRLLFDWRDVFSGGFAFDEFAGDVSIQQGVARSSNLRMRGLQASVVMDGSADLRAETTELKVLVIPEFDAGGAALAYATVNPAVGLTTFLAQLLLKKPIAAANTTQLRISGPWSDPKVEKIEKSNASNAAAPPVAPTP